MKTSLSLMAIMFAFNSVSNAAPTGLEGNYRYSGEACTSGVPAKGFVTEQIEGGINGHLSLNSTHLRFKMELNYKFKPEYAAPLLKQLQDLIRDQEKLPDSAEKNKNLESLKKSEMELRKGMEGKSCSTTVLRTYRINGNTIHSDPVSQSSNCEGGDTPDRSDDSIFEVVGNTLRVTPVVPSESSSCPKGDRVTTLFEKIN